MERVCDQARAVAIAKIMNESQYNAREKTCYDMIPNFKMALTTSTTNVAYSSYHPAKVYY